MIHFVGAGPGAEDLITVKGARLLKETDIIIYAGSLVNPALLGYGKAGCQVYNSAEMTLEEVIDVMKDAESKAKQAESKAEQAESKAKQAESKAEQAESKAKQAESKVEYLRALLIANNIDPDSAI